MALKRGVHQELKVVVEAVRPTNIQEALKVATKAEANGVSNRWMKSSSSLELTNEPNVLTPSLGSVWEYNDTGHLAQISSEFNV